MRRALGSPSHKGREAPADYPDRDYVITRINLPVGQRWDDPSWIEHRLSVCLDRTARSVHQQTRGDFEWWWVACRSTPRNDDMITSAAHSANASLHWVEAADIEPLRTAVRKITGVKPGRVFVTRLDSDDVLHPTFVERVRARAEAESGQYVLINPLIGAIGCDGRVAIWPYVASNFLTSVSTVDEQTPLRTGYDFSHDLAQQEAKVVHMVSQPLWLVISHRRWSPLLAVRTTSALAAAIITKPQSRARLASLFLRSKEAGEIA